jgi:hypothetical protein
LLNYNYAYNDITINIVLSKNDLIIKYNFR